MRGHARESTTQEYWYRGERWVHRDLSMQKTIYRLTTEQSNETGIYMKLTSNLAGGFNQLRKVFFRVQSQQDSDVVNYIRVLESVSDFEGDFLKQSSGLRNKWIRKLFDAKKGIASTHLSGFFGRLICVRNGLLNNLACGLHVHLPDFAGRVKTLPTEQVLCS